MGAKLGADIDLAARLTLDTIWGHFVQGGGFRHDTAWRAFGPYLTLQLAHAFLLLGNLDRMDQCLAWAVGNAGYAQLRDTGTTSAWQVTQGAWNEQHCYPVDFNFTSSVNDWWYMGDLPHGWAAAELILLLRDILFFEADEDRDPHIFLAPGLMPHWIADNGRVVVRDAPTLFGSVFGYELTLDAAARRITVDITQPPPATVRYVFPWRTGEVQAVTADGNAIPVAGQDVPIPAGTRHIELVYQ